MSFLYPQFLWALTSVLIPIIIHLFDFQKPKKIFFTNVRLLQQLSQSTNKGFKAKYLWVLICRILFIVFLVLAFTQPFIPSTSNSKISNKQAVGLYIDNSLSMQQIQDGKSSLNAALDEAQSIAEIFPINTLYQFLDNNFVAKDQYVVNKEQLKDRFTETTFSPISRDLNSVIKRQKNAFENLPNNTKKNIFLISDFQKTTIGDLNTIKADSNTIINLLPINNINSGNVYIDTVWLQNPFIKPKEINNLTVKIRNTADKPSNKISLKLLIEGIQVSSNSAVIAPNTAQEVNFSFIINEVGFKKCSISFDDSPVTFDNTFYFTLQAAQPINILTMGETKDNYLSKVYSSEGFFNLESNINNGLNYSALNNANLIALQEFDKLDESVLGQIKSKVEKGASVIMFPSSDAKVKDINSTLSAFGISVSETTINEQIKIQNPDINNPFYHNIFEKYTGNENMPQSMPLFDFKIKALLKFKNNQTFLGEKAIGKGKLYVCNSSLNPNSGNIASHALFVPIMYKLAILSTNSQQALAHTFNEKTISLKLDSDDKQTPLKLIGNGIEIIPQYQWLNGQLNLQIPKLQIEPGYYELKQGEKRLNILALNFGKEESTLSYYSADDLKKIFLNHKNIKVFDATESGDASASIKTETLGFSFWKYCLILSLLFLFIEIVLIQWINIKTVLSLKQLIKNKPVG